ncbi:MAG: hypothetical protein M1816_004245 [Peltula sp. TS41687]|nr:MAG: hypothetical protein M1816_004245 [Peltula sp. TS41687]
MELDLNGYRKLARDHAVEVLRYHRRPGFKDDRHDEDNIDILVKELEGLKRHENPVCQKLVGFHKHEAFSRYYLVFEAESVVSLRDCILNQPAPSQVDRLGLAVHLVDLIRRVAQDLPHYDLCSDNLIFSLGDDGRIDFSRPMLQRFDCPRHYAKTNPSYRDAIPDRERFRSLRFAPRRDLESTSLIMFEIAYWTLLREMPSLDSVLKNLCPLAKGFRQVLLVSQLELDSTIDGDCINRILGYLHEVLKESHREAQTHHDAIKSTYLNLMERPSFVRRVAEVELGSFAFVEWIYTQSLSVRPEEVRHQPKSIIDLAIFADKHGFRLLQCQIHDLLYQAFIASEDRLVTLEHVKNIENIESTPELLRQLVADIKGDAITEERFSLCRYHPHRAPPSDLRRDFAEFRRKLNIPCEVRQPSGDVSAYSFIETALDCWRDEVKEQQQLGQPHLKQRLIDPQETFETLRHHKDASRLQKRQICKAVLEPILQDNSCRLLQFRLDALPTPVDIALVYVMMEGDYPLPYIKRFCKKHVTDIRLYDILRESPSPQASLAVGYSLEHLPTSWWPDQSQELIMREALEFTSDYRFARNLDLLLRLSIHCGLVEQAATFIDLGAKMGTHEAQFIHQCYTGWPRYSCSTEQRNVKGERTEARKAMKYLLWDMPPKQAVNYKNLSSIQRVFKRHPEISEPLVIRSPSVWKDDNVEIQQHSLAAAPTDLTRIRRGASSTPDLLAWGINENNGVRLFLVADNWCISIQPKVNREV